MSHCSKVQSLCQFSGVVGAGRGILNARENDLWTGDRVQAWRQSGLRDYSKVKLRLPVLEESVTPLASGDYVADAFVASAPEVALLRVHALVRSSGVTVLDPTCVGFAIPLRWDNEYVINGERVTSASSIHLPAEGNIVYVHGGRRETLGVILSRRRLTETLAALGGIDPEDLKFDGRRLDLQHADAATLRRGLVAIIDEACRRGERTESSHGAAEFSNEVFGLLVDAYLQARPVTSDSCGSLQRMTPIVRKAEERFMASIEDPVSLADLCAAAGVGKSTLYRAFHQICGESPLQYFRKRRLTFARSHLMRASTHRGEVKRAALSAGLTELGRFSIEYRQLFGESPSTTLNTIDT